MNPNMTLRQKRLFLAVAALGLAAVSAVLVLNAFRSNVVFFFSPSDVLEQKAPKEKLFRLGGLVEPGSVKRLQDGITVRFGVTDQTKTVAVEYVGILPDLFKEGKGVVAQGRLEAGGVFRAQEVLAKHDENYMPPEAATALERAAKAKQQAQASMK
jgi:cytochrome c-type biogenesis protein CcmE